MAFGKPDLEDVVNEMHFKKVKEYLAEHGPTPSIVIAEETKVPIHVIDKLLRQGRIEIPESEEKLLPCEKCGKDIRYGRFCPECAASLGKEIKGMLTYGEIGEVPKKPPTGKMHFLGKEK